MRVRGLFLGVGTCVFMQYKVVPFLKLFEGAVINFSITIQHVNSTNQTFEINVERNAKYHTAASIVKRKEEPPWTPSFSWIQECVDYEERNNPLVQQPYTVQWHNYQLGDSVRMCKPRVCNKHRDRFKGTIAAEYCEKSCPNKYNYTFLRELFHRYANDEQPWPIPDPDEIVVHVRLGDVMDEDRYIQGTNVTQMLFAGADTRHAETAVYKSGIRSIAQYLQRIRKAGVSKVSLRGGSHFEKVYPRSRIYSSCLVKALRQAGYDVKAKLAGEANPDQDFYYMANAKYFIQGTGGYSKLMAAMVNQGGGVVFPLEHEECTKKSPEEC